MLTLWGSPFGDVNQANGQITRQLNAGILAHYGHAGRRFIEFLVANRASWDQWRQEYQELQRQYEERAADDSVAMRMAANFAAIAMTARLVHEAMELPWEFSDPVEPLWDELVGEAQEVDRATAALRFVWDWANSHMDEFFGKRKSDQHAPPGGWVGRWTAVEKPGDPPRGPWLGFYPHVLKKILEAEGFDVNAINRTWNDRGWLVTTKEKRGNGKSTTRLQVKARLTADSHWFVGIQWKAIDAINGTTSDAEDEIDEPEDALQAAVSGEESDGDDEQAETEDDDDQDDERFRYRVGTGGNACGNRMTS